MSGSEKTGSERTEFREVCSPKARDLSCLRVVQLALVSFLFGQQASAQQVDLVVDLAPAAAPAGEQITGWVPVGSGMLFSSFSPDQRSQLWFTDGTPGGTRFLLEGLPETFGASGITHDLRGTSLSDGTALFSFRGLSDKGLGYELWRSDGTSAGTSLVADLCPGPCNGFLPSNENGHGFQHRSGRVFFIGRAGPGESHVYSFDPENGLERVSELLASGFALTSVPLPSGPGGGGPPGPAIYILGRDGAEAPLTLWIYREAIAQEQGVVELSDVSVKTMQPFRDGALALLHMTDGTDGLYFVGEEGLDLLVSDTFLSSPVLSHGFLAGDGTSDLAFVYRRSVEGSCEGLSTNGSVLGTKAFVQFSTSSCWREAQMMGDRLVFVEPSGVGGGRVYASSSSVTSALVLATKAASEVPNGLTVVREGQVMWVDVVEGEGRLLSSSGNTLGTTVRSFAAVASQLPSRHPSGLLGEALLFSADGGGTGLELWKSDGTQQGTVLVKNMTPDEGSSSPSDLLATEHGLIFSTGDIVDASQSLSLLEQASSQPFTLADDRRTVGTVGSKLLTTTAANGFSSGPTVAIDLVSGLEETLFTGIVGPISELTSGLVVQSLRRGEGQGQNGELLLDALWFTDGSALGTVRLPTPVPSTPFQGTAPQGVSTGGEVFFLLPLGETGESRLWRTRGTVGTTNRLNGASNIREILGAGDGVVYASVLDNGEAHLAAFHGSIGTLVAPKNPSEKVGLGQQPLRASQVAELRGRVVWYEESFADDGSTLPTTLWISDATVAGTVGLGSFTVIRGPLVANRGLVFFSAGTPDAGLEQWVTDGTFEGTHTLGDVSPGVLGSQISSASAVDGIFGFSQSSTSIGHELWLSDGTSAGTEVIEIEAGKRGSGPAGFAPSGDRVFVSANRSDVGRELFSVDRLALRRPCVASATTICLGEGRFSLEVEWLDRVSGNRGVGGAVPLRADTGSFWFFDESNVELVVKVLDARGFSDHWWVFLGALSDVNYWLTVVDTWSGKTRTYTNLQGDICGVNDTSAFQSQPEIDNLGDLGGASGTGFSSLSRGESSLAVPEGTSARGNSSNCGEDVLCLGQDRFEIRVDFQVSGAPEPGVGKAVPGTDDTGYFWFFDEQNIELAIKVIDGRAINGNFWLFYGGLSDVEYTVTATDTVTGVSKQYHNEDGSICGVADVDAFPEAVPE